MKAARAFPASFPATAPLAAILALALCGLASCNLAPGGGTDVGNPEIAARINGSILHRDGSPAALVQVHLRPTAFLSNPDGLAGQGSKAVQDGSSDTQGFFTFDSVPKGDYRIEAVDTSSRGAVISISADGRTDRFTVDPLIVDTTGWITGKVNYAGPALGNSEIIIAVYGMDRWTASIISGDFTLSALPPGTYTLRISAFANPLITTTVPDVKLTAGGRVSVGTVNLAGP